MSICSDGVLHVERVLACLCIATQDILLFQAVHVFALPLAANVCALVSFMALSAEIYKSHISF